jgi:hypothetical protein
MAGGNNDVKISPFFEKAGRFCHPVIDRTRSKE